METHACIGWGACRGLPVACVPRAGAVWDQLLLRGLGKRKEEPEEETLFPRPQNRVLGAEPRGLPQERAPAYRLFEGEAVRQQECPPKSPRGLSAVASLLAEIPKVAPDQGRGAGGGLGPRLPTSPRP